MILRKASSMIELVIAIVVMGIAVMALPLMLTTTQENNKFSIQQEAILAARTQIGDMLTYPWDENSIDNTYVLDTNSTNAKFERIDTNNTRRVGHVVGDKRRKYFSTAITATLPPKLGSDVGDAGTIDDIDDFKTGTPTTVNKSNETAALGLDYRFGFNMTTDVKYVDDIYNPGTVFELKTADATKSTNIKMVELTLQGEEINTFKLRAYSTNIGESELLRRDY